MSQVNQFYWIQDLGKNWSISWILRPEKRINFTALEVFTGIAGFHWIVCNCGTNTNKLILDLSRPDHESHFDDWFWLDLPIMSCLMCSRMIRLFGWLVISNIDHFACYVECWSVCLSSQLLISLLVMSNADHSTCYLKCWSIHSLSHALITLLVLELSIHSLSHALITSFVLGWWILARHAHQGLSHILKHSCLRGYMPIYWSESGPAKKMRDHVHTNCNCEDLAMNFLSAELSKASPLAVSVGNIFGGNVSMGLSGMGNAGHYMARTRCISMFSGLLGNFPLKNSVAGKFRNGEHAFESVEDAQSEADSLGVRGLEGLESLRCAWAAWLRSEEGVACGLERFGEIPRHNMMRVVSKDENLHWHPHLWEWCNALDVAVQPWCHDDHDSMHVQFRLMEKTLK